MAKKNAPLRPSAHADVAEDDAGRFERKPSRPAGRPIARKRKRAAERRAKKIGLVEGAAPMVEVLTPNGPLKKLTDDGIAKAERAQQLLQDVFTESLEIVQDQLAAFDIDPDAKGEDVPAHWRTELPDEIAVQRRKRIAQASLLPGRDAPCAFEAARAVVQNTMRMQAKQMNVMNVKKLNVAVLVGGTKHEYPELEIVAGGAEWEKDD